MHNYYYYRHMYRYIGHTLKKSLPINTLPNLLWVIHGPCNWSFRVISNIHIWIFSKMVYLANVKKTSRYFRCYLSQGYLLVQSQLSVGSIRQSWGQEWEASIVTCAKHHSINVIFHCTIFKHNPWFCELCQIGLHDQCTMKDAAREIIIDQRPSVQKSIT